MWHKTTRENYFERSTGRRQNTELTITHTISELSVTVDICLAVDDQIFPFPRDI